MTHHRSLLFVRQHRADRRGRVVGGRGHRQLAQPSPVLDRDPIRPHRHLAGVERQLGRILVAHDGFVLAEDQLLERHVRVVVAVEVVVARDRPERTTRTRVHRRRGHPEPARRAVREPELDVDGQGDRHAVRRPPEQRLARRVDGRRDELEAQLTRFATDIGQRRHRFVAAPEAAVVHPREVRDVDEVLDPASCRRRPRVRRAGEHLEARVAPRRVRGHRRRRARHQPHPHESVRELHVERRQVRALGDRTRRKGRDVGAAAARLEAPPVVGAAEDAAVGPPHREPGRPVRTPIDDRHHVGRTRLAQVDHGQRCVQESHRQRVRCGGGELAERAHGVPAVAQRRVEVRSHRSRVAPFNKLSMRAGVAIV